MKRLSLQGTRWWAGLVACLVVFSYGCQSSVPTGLPDTKSAYGSLLYASYSYGKYTLYAVDAKTLQVQNKLYLAEGWGDSIFEDGKGRIWCPVYYKPDMTTVENFVEVVDPVTAKKTPVQVGLGPRNVFFTAQGAYVVCEEDGENPSVYFVDQKLEARKVMTIAHGGLISGVQFDGETFYLSSLRNDPNHDFNKDVPMLVRAPLHGTPVMRTLSDTPKGFNNLWLHDGHLFMGLQEEQGTISEYDAATLKRVKIWPYSDMVGEFVDLGQGKVAVTNYSKRTQHGSAVTLFDVATGKQTGQFFVSNLAEHVSYLQGKFYAVDNLHLKIEVLDAKGKSVQIVSSPTQVTNLLVGKEEGIE